MRQGLASPKTVFLSCISNIEERWLKFFERNPLFYGSLFFFFGTVFGLSGRIFLAALLFVISLLLFRSLLKAATALLFFSLGTFFSYTQVINPSHEYQGTAYYSSGTLKCFLDNEGICRAKNIPCKLDTPSPESDWIIRGTLENGRLKPESSVFWREVKPCFSSRGRLKSAVEDFVRKNIPDEKSAEFINGMITGRMGNPELKNSFQRFGLQHLLAISGFHFSLLAFIASVFLRPLFRGRLLIGALIIILTLYLLFLGSSPSIIRAFVTISLSQLGACFEKRITPFNALATALIVVILMDPLYVANLGFILSFGITFSILAFTNPMKSLMGNWLPERSINSVYQMDKIDQIGFIAVSWMKNMLALSMAVNIIAIPLTFALFGKFPLFSLVFNLFFPFLAANIMFLFAIASAVTPFFYPLGKLLFLLVSKGAAFSLNMLEMPNSWNYEITYQPSEEMALGMLFFVFLSGFFMKEKEIACF